MINHSAQEVALKDVSRLGILLHVHMNHIISCGFVWLRHFCIIVGFVFCDVVDELPALMIKLLELVEHRLGIVLVAARQDVADAVHAVLDVVAALVVQSVGQVVVLLQVYCFRVRELAAVRVEVGSEHDVGSLIIEIDLFNVFV